MTFAEGSKVVVHSLKKEGRLNGVKATIMHYSTERKRYAVLIEGESKGVMMLEKNLKLVEGEEATPVVAPKVTPAKAPTETADVNPRSTPPTVERTYTPVTYPDASAAKPADKAADKAKPPSPAVAVAVPVGAPTSGEANIVQILLKALKMDCCFAEGLDAPKPAIGYAVSTSA